MPFHHFPADFVYWQNLENHKKIKDKLLPEILKNNKKYKNNPFENCNFNSSFFKDERMLSENEFLVESDILDEIVFNPLTKMIQEYNKLNLFTINPAMCTIHTAWWNIYDKGDFQEMHTHKGRPVFKENNIFYPSFSIIYILKDENEKSSVIFKKENVSMKVPTFDHEFNTSRENSIKEGTVLIFPSDMNHLVKPCIKPGRVTIAYNICSSWGRSQI